MAIQIPGMTVNQTANRLGVTEGRVRQLLRKGLIAGVKITERCWIIDPDSVTLYAGTDRRPGPKRVQNS